MNISINTIDPVVNWIGLVLGVAVAILGWVQWRNREDSRAHARACMLTMLLGIVIAVLAVVSQFTGAHLQARSDAELGALQNRAADLSDQLERIRMPRSLSEGQKRVLREQLRLVPKGPVVVTFLSVATDAEKYSQQICQILEERGFPVTRSKRLWLQLAFEGEYLCARREGSVPAHGPGIQNAFKAAGIKMKAFYDTDFLDKLGVPDAQSRCS